MNTNVQTHTDLIWSFQFDKGVTTVTIVGAVIERRLGVAALLAVRLSHAFLRFRANTISTIKARREGDLHRTGFGEGLSPACFGNVYVGP